MNKTNPIQNSPNHIQKTELEDIGDEFDEFIKLKKEIYALTDDKLWQDKQFIPDVRIFLLSKLKEQKEKIIHTLESKGITFKDGTKLTPSQGEDIIEIIKKI